MDNISVHSGKSFRYGKSLLIMTQEQIDQLKQLHELYEKGILTKEEVNIEKTKILNANNNINQTKKSSNNFHIDLTKLKIPLLILAGMIVGWIGYIIVCKFINFSKDNKEVDEITLINTEPDDIFEDKFEKMWVTGSSRNFTEEDFKGWNNEDLRILRNYFFAKNNFIFNSKELTNYFSKYSWYEAKYKDVGDMFSDLQTNNVQYIKKLEGLPNYHK